MKKLLILIPTYNEAGNIEKLIDRLEYVANHKLSRYTVGILVIDDHSPDQTALLVKSKQKQFRNIDLLEGEKTGLGDAYLRGFKFALDRKLFDVLVMMDADFSHDPNDISKLLTYLDKGTACAQGSRYITNSREATADWSTRRIILSRSANYIGRKLAGIMAIHDITSGFKAIKREAIEAIDLEAIDAHGYYFQVALLRAILAKNFVVKEMPIIFSSRQSGKSKLRLNDILEFIYLSYKSKPDGSRRKFLRFVRIGA